MPGDAIILVSDRGGRIRSFVDALTRFPSEPQWSVVGGFAVNVRITQVHRLTNDLDTLSRDQTSLVEVLVAELGADRLDAAKLQLDQDGTTVVIDVMWVGNTLVKWFSPAQDLRYTYARLRRLARSIDAEALTEDDLAAVAELGRVLLD